MTLTQVDHLPPPRAELMHRWEGQWSDWVAQHNTDSLRRVLWPPPKPDGRVLEDLKTRNVPQRVPNFVGRNEAKALNEQMDANWRSYCQASPFRAASLFGSRRYPIAMGDVLAVDGVLPSTAPQDCAALADMNRRCEIAIAHNTLLMATLYEPTDRVCGPTLAADYPNRLAAKLKASLCAEVSSYNVFLADCERDGAEVARFVWARILLRTAAEVRPCLYNLGFPPPTLVLRNTAGFCVVWRLTNPIVRQDAERLNKKFLTTLGAAEQHDDAVGQPLGVRYLHAVPLLVGEVHAGRTPALTLWNCCNSAIERGICARFGA